MRLSLLPRRYRPLTLAAAAMLTVGCLSVATQSPALAAQTIGFPTFSGPAIPAAPVGYTAGNMMQAIYNAEVGGTDFWMDRMLARPGNDPAGTWLMTRGRALYMKTHNPGTLGFSGQSAYWES